MSLSPVLSEMESIDMALQGHTGLDNGQTCGPAPRAPAGTAHASCYMTCSAFPLCLAFMEISLSFCTELSHMCDHFCTSLYKWSLLSSLMTYFCNCPLL